MSTALSYVLDFINNIKPNLFRVSLINISIAPQWPSSSKQEQLNELKQIIISITEDLMSYKIWDAIQENVLTRHASFQSKISLINNKKSLQKLRDLDNAFQIMIDLKRERTRFGSDEFIQARDRLDKASIAVIKKL